METIEEGMSKMKSLFGDSDDSVHREFIKWVLGRLPESFTNEADLNMIREVERMFADGGTKGEWAKLNEEYCRAVGKLQCSVRYTTMGIAAWLCQEMPKPKSDIREIVWKMGREMPGRAHQIHYKEGKDAAVKAFKVEESLMREKILQLRLEEAKRTRE